MQRLPLIGDVLLAALFTLAAELDVWVRGTVVGPHVTNGVILAFVGPPLILRRRRPTATAALVSAAVLAQALVVGHPPSGFLYWPILIAAYSLGAYGPVARFELSALAGLLAVYAYLTVTWESSSSFAITDVPWSAAPLLTWGAGIFMRRRRARATDAADSVRRERAREQDRLAALEHERTRMARELHDILAHSVSLMGVQAGAAEQVLGTDPERAVPVLQSIQRTARDSVGELRRLLAMLRADDFGTDLAPQPSLHELETLLARMREAGLPVEIRFEGPTQQIPPGIELTAYRVVQEALTNALKHARPAQVDVSFRYEGDRLDIDVWNDGVQDRAKSNGPGHGLIGMRERVSLYGGTLDAQPEDDGTFRVLASIPLT